MLVQSINMQYIASSKRAKIPQRSEGRLGVGITDIGYSTVKEKIYFLESKRRKKKARR